MADGKSLSSERVRTFDEIVRNALGMADFDGIGVDLGVLRAGKLIGGVMIRPKGVQWTSLGGGNKLCK